MLPEGTETFQNAAGCDSIVAVRLDLRDEAVIRFVDMLLCRGESTELNGEVFDYGRVQGTRLDPGVFVFSARVLGSYGSVKELTGDVTVVR